MSKQDLVTLNHIVVPQPSGTVCMTSVGRYLGIIKYFCGTFCKAIRCESNIDLLANVFSGLTNWIHGLN